MRFLHHIWLTVYSKPEDDEGQIKENLIKFFPFDLKEEKIPIDQKTATSFEERKIRIFQVHLQTTKHLNKFMQHLNKLLTDAQKAIILEQKSSRLDQDNHFFLRFAKEDLIKKNFFLIVDHGNCYHLKFSIAAYPATRENAMKVVEKLFTPSSL